MFQTIVLFVLLGGALGFTQLCLSKARVAFNKGNHRVGFGWDAMLFITALVVLFVGGWVINNL
jgi:hypothetical protein